MNRTSSVLRLQLANPRALFFAMGVSTAIALTITLAAGGIARAVGAGPTDLAEMNQGMAWSGAIWAVLGQVIAVAVVTMNQMLDLALGLGLTRREYARGTALLMTATALFTTVAVTVLKVVERATSGWFLSVRMFDVVWVNVGPWWQTAIQTLLLCAVLLGVGGALTGVFRRWGSSGTWLTLAGVFGLALLVGAIVLIVPSVRTAALAMLTWPWAAWMGIMTAVAALLALCCWVFIRSAEVS